MSVETKNDIIPSQIRVSFCKETVDSISLWCLKVQASKRFFQLDIDVRAPIECCSDDKIQVYGTLDSVWMSLPICVLLLFLHSAFK